MGTSEAVVEHYAMGDDAARQLLNSIESGLTALGSSLASATVEVLAPVDEFHVGGRPATIELCQQLGANESSTVLDVGSGIGGTARFIASTFGTDVTGIDLTPEYVEVANELSQATGLGGRTRFEHGSATELPFDDESFDIATQLHVGMNIADKDRLFAEVFRVLRPAGRFGVYDMMRQTDADFSFPVPWATDQSMSFVEPPSTYLTAAEAAGFELVGERNRAAFASTAFAALRKQSSSGDGPPPLGLHLVMGSGAPIKVKNMVAAVTSGTLAPIELIWQKSPVSAASPVSGT